jgi:hypothetical protein
MKIYFAPVLVTVLIFTVSPSRAERFPAQLLGKTIKGSYVLSIPIMGRRGPIVATRQVTGSIYISSAGRIFARTETRANNGETSFRERAPGASSWRFIGGKLVSTHQSISGAVELQISFDPSFQSCTGSGIIGRENGKPYQWTGLNGDKYQATGPGTISEGSCSITTGNGL